MSLLNIVGLSGSVTRPSRTTALVRRVLDRLDRTLGTTSNLIELADDAPHLFAALTRPQLAGRAREVIDAVEGADLLVAGTPVYRASFTGAFKHVFDLVDHRAFPGKPVILAATGGTPMHGLVTEHQLRPLFGFLNALTLPTTLYAVETSFADYRLEDSRLEARIDKAVEEAAGQLAHAAPRPAEQDRPRALARA